MATGLRHKDILYKGKGTGLRWDQIDWEEKTVHVDTKSRELDLPLADGVLAIIDRQPRVHECVFPFCEARSDEMKDPETATS